MNISNNDRLAYLRQFEKDFDKELLDAVDFLFILEAELDNIPEELISV